MPSPITNPNSLRRNTVIPYPANIQKVDHSQSSTQRESVSENNDQYNDFILQRKKLQSTQQTQTKQSNQKLYVAIVTIFFSIMLVSAIVYSIKFRSNSKIYPILDQQNQDQTIAPPNHFYTRHQHHAAIPSASPGASPSTDNCDLLLPYDIAAQSRQDVQKDYYQWYGKVGSNINGRSYDVGHFIERHVAVGGKCTEYQKTQQKSVFYDWNQVTKAYKQTLANLCPLGDRTTFSYDFEVKIASPTDYIKGIDCRSGTVRKYSRVFALYRRAINKRYPNGDEYLKSNYVTLWTFYPKI